MNGTPVFKRPTNELSIVISMTSSYYSTSDDGDSEGHANVPSKEPAPDTNSSRKSPTSSDSEGQEEWEVEKVIGKRVRRGRVQYLLKWKGYPTEESTWEDAEDCFCTDLVNEFLQKEKRNEDRKARTPPVMKTSSHVDFIEIPKLSKERTPPKTWQITKIGKVDGKCVYVMKNDDGESVTVDSAQARKNNATELARQLELALFSQIPVT